MEAQQLFNPETFEGRQRFYFPNGYGASVIQNQYSYGGDEGLYELAVLKGNSGFARLVYYTPITNDVLGWLTPKGVEDALRAIESLPPVGDILLSDSLTAQGVLSGRIEVR